MSPSEKKIFVRFSKRALWLALGVVFLISCSKEPKTFSALLKEVKKIAPEKKEERLTRFVLGHHFPFVEDSTAYFVVQDTSGSPVYLAGDFTFWRPDSIRLKQIPGTDYGYAAITFPLDARLEYKFVVGKNWILDPLNPFKEEGGMGENSVLMMPGYIFPKETLLIPKFRVSTLDTLLFKSDLLKNRRKVYLYRHPKANGQSPLLLVNDGGDYLRFAKTRIVLDNLIGQNKIRPVNVLFIDPVKRMKEYWLNDRYLKMIFTELLPQIEKNFSLRPQSLGIGGASLGGEISLYALKDYAEKLSFVFSQSGSLAIDDGKILEILQTAPQIKGKIYLSYGQFEPMALSHTRLAQIFRQKKVTFELHRFPEGHNWGNWRGQLSEIFEYFYGGQNE